MSKEVMSQSLSTTRIPLPYTLADNFSILKQERRECNMRFFLTSNAFFHQTVTLLIIEHKW